MAEKNTTINCPKCKTPLTIPGRPKRDLIVQCSECGHKGKLPRKRQGSTAQPIILKAAIPEHKTLDRATESVTLESAPPRRGRSWLTIPLVLLAIGGLGYAGFLYLDDSDKPVEQAKSSVVESPAKETPQDSVVEVSNDTVAVPVARRFIDTNEVFKRMQEDLQNNVSRFDRRSIRYFTLAHLHNAGVSEEQLEKTRQAFVKLLNSLSWERELYNPVAIDDEQTIYRVDILKLDWNSHTWKSIVGYDPYAFAAGNAHAAACAETTGESVFAVRADWFVFAASQPALYYAILGIPDTLEQMAKLLRVNIAKNIDSRDVVRAGLRKSEVSDYNRLIERHETATGGFWVAYGFSGHGDRQDLFRYPLGPGDGASQFHHDGAAVIFGLPNGMQGYMLTDANGRRVDHSQESIIRDSTQYDKVAIAGASCISCHRTGVIPVADEVANAVKLNREGFSRVESILEMHQGTFKSLQEKDTRRFQDSLAKLKLSSSSQDEDPVQATIKCFESNVDVHLAAAEWGFSKDDFVSKIDSVSGMGALLGNYRTSSGTLSRYQLLEIYDDVARALQNGTPLCSVDISNAYSRLPSPHRKTQKASLVTSTQNTEPVPHEPSLTPKTPKTPAPEKKTATTPLSVKIEDVFGTAKATFVSFDGQQVSYREPTGISKTVAVGTLSSADQEFVLKQNPAASDLPGDLPTDAPTASPSSTPTKPKSILSSGEAELVSFDGRQNVTVKFKNGDSKSMLIDSLSPEDIEHVLKRNVTPGSRPTEPVNVGSDLPGGLPSNGGPATPPTQMGPGGNRDVWFGADGKPLIEGRLHSFYERKGLARIAPAPRLWTAARQAPFPGVFMVASSTGDGQVQVKVKRGDNGRTENLTWAEISEADQKYLELIRAGLRSGRIKDVRSLLSIRYWEIPMNELGEEDQKRVLTEPGYRE